MECAIGGTLEQLATCLGALQEVEVASLIRQVVDGLVHLHALDIIHRDIKGANLVVKLNGCVKITDLGCSRRIDGLCSTLQLTRWGLTNY